MGNIFKYIRIVIEYSGKIVSIVFLFIMIFTTGEVLLRYVFNSPTHWVWEINLFLFALASMFAGGYALIEDAHVNVDLIQNKLTENRRILLSILSSPILLIGLIVLIWLSFKEAVRSVFINETTSGMFKFPLYLIKIAIFIGAVLLLFGAIYKIYEELRKYFRE